MELFCGQSAQVAKRIVCTAIIMEPGERHLDAGSTGLWDVDVDELVFKMNHVAGRVTRALMAPAGFRDRAVCQHRAEGCR